jgi:hypothetical protein
MTSFASILPPFDAADDGRHLDRCVTDVPGTTVPSSLRRPPERVASDGWMVLTPTAEHPYKVVLEYETGAGSQHTAASMVEGEAFIRRMMPSPPLRDTLRDRGGPIENSPGARGDPASTGGSAHAARS